MCSEINRDQGHLLYWLCGLLPLEHHESNTHDATGPYRMSAETLHYVFLHISRFLPLASPWRS